ncbi:serine/arginine repetitive matrix protein 2-like [Homarus americanus]|uniref:serine/arginine repetitive matrix protein 2-like n=1 Tax=Homarus americanus TaxID=6706 RepID=UPI001C45E7F6|nr:serine/arginine repetitive matrix protein 2-like [Homarus americanus]
MFGFPGPDGEYAPSSQELIERQSQDFVDERLAEFQAQIHQLQVMADKSPGKPPPSGGGDDRGRPDKHKRSLLNRVSFFEQVWWGRNRSPSLERKGSPIAERGRSPSLERGEEVFADEMEEGPGKEKRRRRESTSPGRETPLDQRRSSAKSDEDWELVEPEDEATSTLAEDIERRLEERRRMRSGSMTPTREWVQLRRGSDDQKVPDERRGSTPEPWESTYSTKEGSLAEEIERRLEHHRQEVRQKLVSPVKDWPLLRRSPAQRSSRGTTPERETPDLGASFTSRSRTTSGDRRRSRERSASPGRHTLVREVVANAERRGGEATAVTTTTHTATVWTSEDGEPHVETHSTTDNLQEEDPNSEGRDVFQRVEEEEHESVERGERKRYNRVVVRRSVERTITTTPSPEPMEQEQLSPRLSSPTLDPAPQARTTRSRTPSGPKSRLRSRTPSVERILEVEEEETTAVFLTSSTDPRVLDDEKRSDTDTGSASPEHGADKLQSSDESARESGRDSKSPEDHLTMETVSTVQWEGGAKGEVQKHSTRVLIRDRDPSYTKYVITSRTTSRDSLFSSPSSEDAPSWDGSAPAWASRTTLQEEDEEDHAPSKFRLRSHQYQEHISTLKGERGAGHT